MLLVEDAQYADAGLLDFLDHLIDWSRDLPVYVLVFARPELGQARPGFGTGRNRITLTLDPLDPASMDQLVDALVPGMPAGGPGEVTAQAQGIPLFAVETVRALIDRDIVQPSEGVYRLVGDVGELAVPDSLHALLAARLDALDPEVRRLVTDAAVLGTSFPAEALVAVSGRDEAGRAGRAGRAGAPRGAERVSRSAVTGAGQLPVRPADAPPGRLRHPVPARPQDPPPESGRAPARRLFPATARRSSTSSPGTTSTRCTPPPTTPTPTRSADQAIAALIRAAERAERTGAPAVAATSYATAAELTTVATKPRADSRTSALLWEHAAQAASTKRQLGCSCRACGPGPRPPPRARPDPGGSPRPGHRRQALRRWGRHAEAREQLIAAIDPASRTRRRHRARTGQLATVEVFAGSPTPTADDRGAHPRPGPRRGAGQLGDLFTIRGIYLALRRAAPEAIAYLRESARLATQAGDNFRLGRALLNLSAALIPPSRRRGRSRAHRRRPPAPGRRPGLPGLCHREPSRRRCSCSATGMPPSRNSPRQESDGLADIDYLACYQAWLAALRGDAATAETMLAALRDMRDSEDPQDHSLISVMEAFAAAARSRPQMSLSHARAHAGPREPSGISHDYLRWAWPLAARAADDLRDNDAPAI